jgi:hypothetical protein
MQTAIVWTPLAINPPNGPAAEPAASVWMDCGSYRRAKSTISVSLRVE